MNIILFGAAGFIGTNLTLQLMKNLNNEITLVDVNKNYFNNIYMEKNIRILESGFNMDTDFISLLKGQNVVYHLVSTTVPVTSNQHIGQEITANVVVTSKMLDACVECGVDKVVFISSGGTVYGKEGICPLNENTTANPITSYGIQKITIEKLLYVYKYIYNLDYRIIRLANPYGPYQRPDGILGAVTTFTYKALMNEEIIVYGDGSVIRDFIYIDDVVNGVLKIENGQNEFCTFNLGCGYGTSINQVLIIIQQVLNKELNIIYKEGRKVDVPINYLDISRYERIYGKLNPISLEEGIYKTASFIREYYNI